MKPFFIFYRASVIVRAPDNEVLRTRPAYYVCPRAERIVVRNLWSLGG